MLQRHAVRQHHVVAPVGGGGGDDAGDDAVLVRLHRHHAQRRFDAFDEHSAGRRIAPNQWLKKRRRGSLVIMLEEFSAVVLCIDGGDEIARDGENFLARRTRGIALLPRALAGGNQGGAIDLAPLAERVLVMACFFLCGIIFGEEPPRVVFPIGGIGVAEQVVAVFRGERPRRGDVERVARDQPGCMRRGGRIESE